MAKTEIFSCWEPIIQGRATTQQRRHGRDDTREPLTLFHGCQKRRRSEETSGFLQRSEELAEHVYGLLRHRQHDGDDTKATKPSRPSCETSLKAGVTQHSTVICAAENENKYTTRTSPQSTFTTYSTTQRKEHPPYAHHDSRYNLCYTWYLFFPIIYEFFGVVSQAFKPRSCSLWFPQHTTFSSAGGHSSGQLAVSQSNFSVVYIV